MGFLLGRKGLLGTFLLHLLWLFTLCSAASQQLWKSVEFAPVGGLRLNLQPIDKTSIKARLCVFANIRLPLATGSWNYNVTISSYVPFEIVSPNFQNLANLVKYFEQHKIFISFWFITIIDCYDIHTGTW